MPTHQRSVVVNWSDEAERLCTRVGLVSDGRMVLEGPPAELGAAAGRFEVVVSDVPRALLALRQAGFLSWRDGSRIVIDAGNGMGALRRDGATVAKALADVGIYPQDLRRAPTLEIAYADLIGGFRGRA